MVSRGLAWAPDLNSMRGKQSSEAFHWSLLCGSPGAHDSTHCLQVESQDWPRLMRGFRVEPRESRVCQNLIVKRFQKYSNFTKKKVVKLSKEPQHSLYQLPTSATLLLDLVTSYQHLPRCSLT